MKGILIKKLASKYGLKELMIVMLYQCQVLEGLV